MGLSCICTIRIAPNPEQPPMMPMNMKGSSSKPELYICTQNRSEPAQDQHAMAAGSNACSTYICWQVECQQAEVRQTIGAEASLALGQQSDCAPDAPCAP